MEGSSGKGWNEEVAMEELVWKDEYESIEIEILE